MPRYSRVKALINLDLNRQEREIKAKFKAKTEECVEQAKAKARPKLTDWDNLKSAKPND